MSPLRPRANASQQRHPRGKRPFAGVIRQCNQLQPHRRYRSCAIAHEGARFKRHCRDWKNSFQKRGESREQTVAGNHSIRGDTGRRARLVSDGMLFRNGLRTGVERRTERPTCSCGLRVSRDSAANHLRTDHYHEARYGACSAEFPAPRIQGSLSTCLYATYVRRKFGDAIHLRLFPTLDVKTSAPSIPAAGAQGVLGGNQ